MAPEGLARDGREAACGFEDYQNEDDSVSRVDIHPHSPLLGDHYCKFGADPPDWAVRRYLFSARPPR